MVQVEFGIHTVFLSWIGLDFFSKCGSYRNYSDTFA
jgi:hypothetical protein